MKELIVHYLPYVATFVVVFIFIHRQSHDILHFGIAVSYIAMRGALAVEFLPMVRIPFIFVSGLIFLFFLMQLFFHHPENGFWRVPIAIGSFLLDVFITSPEL